MAKKQSKSKSAKVQVSAKKAEIMSARVLSVTFITWMIGHSSILYLANALFPSHVVLGTNQFSSLQGLFYSMLVFTLIAVGSIPITEYIAILQKKTLKTMDWMVIFFFVNVVGIWLVARFAEQLGLGISSWLVAVALAVVFDIAQGVLVSKVVR